MTSINQHENVRPVKKLRRPIAFHYRDKVEIELEIQVAEASLVNVVVKTCVSNQSLLYQTW